MIEVKIAPMLITEARLEGICGSQINFLTKLQNEAYSFIQLQAAPTVSIYSQRVVLCSQPIAYAPKKACKSVSA